MQSHWVTPSALTEANKKAIKAIFEKKRISDNCFETLCRTIEQLCKMNPRYNRIDTLADAAVVKLVSDMRNHIYAALSVKKQLNDESDLHPRAIDEKVAMNGKNPTLFLSLPSNSNVSGLESLTEDFLMQIWKGLVIQERDLKLALVPSKPKVFTHVHLINELITFFQEEIPNIKPSKSRGSVFEKLIRYILNDIVKHPTTNAQTHIKNAFEARAQSEQSPN